ncbi:hypothetical protein E2C01_001760 [Portunus trituberculatus]|uniref:Uncharacterized protein n=1 Tax=Portunus trituberculatus TaxID=210409 RepID=A0A5B7CL73_PORTR|nr:hypothetical protein [Portunus trituberculatus]
MYETMVVAGRQRGCGRGGGAGGGATHRCRGLEFDSYYKTHFGPPTAGEGSIICHLMGRKDFRLSKCKKNLKPMSSPPSKRTRVKRTQRPTRNNSSFCKSVPKPEWCRQLEKDLSVTEKIHQNTENSETDLVVYNQEEARNSDSEPNSDWGQALDRSQENSLVEQDLDIKEECTLPEETVCVSETTTNTPQKQLTVDCEIVQVPSLHGENFGDETEPVKDTFKDSQSQVLEGQNQGTGAHHVIENYFKEMSSASFSESAYEEEISSPAVMDVQEDMKTKLTECLATDWVLQPRLKRLRKKSEIKSSATKSVVLNEDETECHSMLMMMVSDNRGNEKLMQ